MLTGEENAWKIFTDLTRPAKKQVFFQIHSGNRLELNLCQNLFQTGLSLDFQIQTRFFLHQPVLET